MHEDYGHDMQHPSARAISIVSRPVSGIVIGHFHIGRFSRERAAARVVLLRHPITRAISHFFFWRHVAPPSDRNELWGKVRDGLDLLDFTTEPVIQGLYRNRYFHGADMRSFDLLIIYERLQAGVEALSDMLGAPMRLPVVNTSAGTGRNMRWRKVKL